LLSDLNQDLIDTYRSVRENLAAVRAILETYRVSARSYKRARESEPEDPIERAARFLFLNRTAFSGIYRLNRFGKFNVPYGGGERTAAPLLKTAILDRASAALKVAELRHGDFETSLEVARRGDVVYCDPTYTVAHDNNGFVRYNERNFSWSDQERLCRSAWTACRRGVTVIVSNAHHPGVQSLYSGAEIETLQRISAVSPDPTKRRLVKEYLIQLNASRR
jgi:DNA adenine methylase